MSVSQRIQALPLHLANQIAAGEVIERPASVVKELVENSIDAGATQVFIDIEGAGSHLIRVRDNGNGIHPDDLALALSRHATSKLQSSEQLSHIASLGFRGEALPSIASVSQLTLTSRQSDSELGWQMSIQQDSPSPVSHPLGTTVEVRELFFNVPARKHFLRGDKTESLHITTTLYRLALSQFEVGFTLQLSNQTSIKLPIADSLEKQKLRIGKLCGNAFIKQTQYIEQEFDDIKLSGWVGKSEAHRPQTDINYFFINGRVIRDRVINHAIRQAYGESIPAGRYPAFVLYLTLPLDRVDINVHPTKHEVRFRDARLVHGLITRAIQEALFNQHQENTATHDEVPHVEPLDLFDHQVAESTPEYRPAHTAKPLTATQNFDIARILLQRYVIYHSDNDPEPWLIDLQLGDKRLRERAFIEAFESNTIKSRPILVPIRLSIASSAIDCLDQYQSMLTQFGFTLDRHHEQLTVRAIPTLFTQIDVISFVNELLNYLTDNAPDQSALCDYLQQQLPLLPITSMEQAETILKQLPHAEAALPWCRQLDKELLSSLF